MRGRDHHHAIELPALQQGVGVRGHRSRIHVAGVRRHQGHHVFERRRRGLGQETVDHLPEFLGVGTDRTTRPPPAAGPWALGAPADCRFHRHEACKQNARMPNKQNLHTREPLPNAWDGLAAEPALAPVEMHRPNGEAGALHHHAPAFRAPGTLGRMAGNIADINVVQTLRIADGLGALQRRHRRGRKVLQQVLGMESRKVQRDVRAKLRFHPAGQPAELRRRNRSGSASPGRRSRSRRPACGWPPAYSAPA